MKRWIWLALLLAPMTARASVIETDVSGALDPYTGSTSLIPPAFAGDPATLTSLDFLADVAFDETFAVVGGDGRFTLHFDATMFGQTVASGALSLYAGGGSYATSFSFGFAGSRVMADPEVSIAAWLTPNSGYFASDEAHSISGLVYLRTLYDPPSLVDEPGSGLLVSGLLGGWALWRVSRRRRARVPTA